MMAARAKFDPEKGAKSTLLYTIGSRRVLDVWRRKSRQLGHETRTARSPVIEAPRPDRSEDERDLAAWCAQQRRDCGIAYGTATRRVGATVYPVAQLAAIVLLLVRLSLHPDALYVLVEERPDLRQALGLDAMPERRVFRELGGMVRRRQATKDRPNPAEAN
jgi:DNA-directed RNA polymerase specialized sigma24 family protein